MLASHWRDANGQAIAANGKAGSRDPSPQTPRQKNETQGKLFRVRRFPFINMAELTHDHPVMVLII